MSELELFLIAYNADDRLSEEQREVFWASFEPGADQLEALFAFVGDCTAPELPLQNENDIDWQLCLHQLRGDVRADLK